MPPSDMAKPILLRGLRLLGGLRGDRRAVALVALLALGAPLGSAQELDGGAENAFAVSCESSKDSGRVVFSVPPGIALRGRDLAGGDYAIEVRSADLGELDGRVRCRGKASVRAVPGRMLGSLSSRLVIDLPDGSEPRLTVSVGRAELSWGPPPVQDDSEPPVQDEAEPPTPTPTPTPEREPAAMEERSEEPVPPGPAAEVTPPGEPRITAAELDAVRVTAAELDAVREDLRRQREENERLRAEIEAERARVAAIESASAAALEAARAEAEALRAASARSDVSPSLRADARSTAAAEGAGDVLVGEPVAGSSALTLRPRQVAPRRSSRPGGRGAAASDGVVGVARGAPSPRAPVTAMATPKRDEPDGPPSHANSSVAPASRPPGGAEDGSATRSRATIGDASTRPSPGERPAPPSPPRPQAAPPSRPSAESASRATRAPGAPHAALPTPSRPAPAPADTPETFRPFDAPMSVTAGIATELREGPGRRHAVARKIAPGETLTADGRAGDWLRMSTGDWAFAAFFAPGEDVPGTGPARTRTVRAITAPVHSGPGGQHRIVSEVLQGQTIVVDEILGEWAHVKSGGWVRRAALEGIDE